MEDITNTQLMAKLQQIELMLEKISKEERQIMREEKRIEKEEDAEIYLINTLGGNNDKRQYSSIADWKINVWDNCPEKEEINSSENIDFLCRKSGRNCRFNDCPKNI